jgi:hypothetical protein
VDNLIEDPKLKALMSKLKNHVQRSINQGPDAPFVKPPKTFEDFLANERVVSKRREFLCVTNSK